MKKYDQYSVEDFVLDEGFKAWVLNEPTANETFWREWIANHPGMKPVVEEARQIILRLQTQEAAVSKEEMDEGFREVEAFFEKTMQRQSRWPAKGFWRIAASILALVVAGLGILYQNQPSDQVQQYITKGGQQKKVQLPDGSRVYMKENSRLSYSQDWSESHNRKVQLQGEAYFQVREQLYQGRKVKFIVAANDVSIEVVGTEFVVNNRSSRTRVALNSGRINLRVPQANHALQMSPGDVVEYNASTDQLLSSKKEVGPKSNWLKDFEDGNANTDSNISGSKPKAGVTRGSDLESDAGMKNSNTKTNTTSDQNTAQSSRRWSTASGGNAGSRNTPMPEANISVRGGQTPTHKQGGSMQGSGQNYFINPANPNDQQQSNNAGVVNQSGNQNTAYIEQIGDNLASGQDQSGSKNQASVTIEGAKDQSDDLGWSTWQQQQGSGNVSIFNIVESYNTNIYSAQQGTKNTVQATSEGKNNLGMVRQYGSQNETIILQDGDQNKAFVRQKGSGMEGMDPIIPDALHGGNFNEVEIIQQGRGNQTRNIQRGSNNQISVEQKGN